MEQGGDGVRTHKQNWDEGGILDLTPSPVFFFFFSLSEMHQKIFTGIQGCLCHPPHN